MEVFHLVITGRVQGVGFRHSMAARARSLGITGWVRNCGDGSVEAMIAGDAAPMEEMLAWSRKGPPGAWVDGLTMEPGCGEYHDFTCRPTVPSR